MSGLPGLPLESGFDYKPVEEHPELLMSEEAIALVQAKIDSVHEALRRAAESASTAVIG